MIEGKYAVGKTYVLTETKARDGYATATSIEFTVADDGKVQKVNMVNAAQIKVEFNKIHQTQKTAWWCKVQGIRQQGQKGV